MFGRCSFSLGVERSLWVLCVWERETKSVRVLLCQIRCEYANYHRLWLQLADIVFCPLFCCSKWPFFFTFAIESALFRLLLPRSLHSHSIEIPFRHQYSWALAVFNLILRLRSHPLNHTFVSCLVLLWFQLIFTEALGARTKKKMNRAQAETSETCINP